MFCAYCGAETQSGETSCRACGQPLPDLSGSRLPTVAPPRTRVATIPSGELATAVSPPTSVTQLDAGSGTTLTAGQSFGTRYHIIRELGRGGMGVVYQAWDDELGVAVALKTILADAAEDPETARDREQRFKRELVLARQVTHKHVVRIHDLGEINGIKYLTMPFIQGETLGARIRREGRLPVSHALRFARQIVSGLAAAHEEGVVHRDLKPANIMIDTDEEAVILDFGLARSVSGVTMATATGALMGTLEYMAPEQASGSHVDQRADIYAFGLILHEMLVGRRRSSDSALSELMLRAREAPPSVRSLDPQIPEAVDGIVARCLRPDPGERYQTSAELATSLGQLDAEGAPLLGRRVAAKRVWMVPALAVACVVAVAAAVSLFVWGRSPARAPVAHAPISVLVADFDNQAGDKVFEGALEQALSIAIEGASFINAYSRTDAARVLERIKPGETLSETNARLVAQREGINVVLPGVISRNDAQYTIALKVVDPSGQAQPRSVQTTARSKGEVLTAVVSLSGEVRAFLGDTASASAKQSAAETFTTVSLEAMREYAAAQNLLLRRKDAEAIDHFRAAVQKDPQFGRAYAGWAVAAFNLGRREEVTEQWAKAMKFIDRMTEREKYRTLGGYFLIVTRDFDKAIENFEALIKRYPADTAGQSNLAYAYFQNLNFARAVQEGQRAVDLRKSSLLFRSNYVLYAMYAGQFDDAIKQSEALVKDAPGLSSAYLSLAVSQAATGNLQAARETYSRMASTDAAGASTSAEALADLALYEGKTAEARPILAKGVAADERAGNTGGMVAKYAALADAALLDGDRRGAIEAADALVKLGGLEESALPASLAYLASGDDAQPRRLAALLQSQLPPKTRAYGKIIEGEIALHAGRKAEAIDALKAAVKFADLWFARYALGTAYLENGLYVEALSELELCEKRRGEATALFLDDLPTLRHLAPVSYWLGRAKEGLNSKAAAAENYKAFLSLRPEGSKDPLAIDARARLAAMKQD